MPTRFPLVLAQGLFSFSSPPSPDLPGLQYFRDLEMSLKTSGYTVLITRVTETYGVRERAALLKNQIDDTFNVKRERINIIAHSMGGLDARYMISNLGMGERTASLTTIGTPHRGSHVAEIMLKMSQPFLSRFIQLRNWKDLTPPMCSQFNRKVSDWPSVAYFSYGGCPDFWQMTPLLWFFYASLLKIEGFNDGLVSLASAKWGTYLGHLPADHLQQVGWDLRWKQNRAFNPFKFYRRLAEFLARSGF